MDGFFGNIETLTEQNDCYRKVLYTGNNLQLVLMSIQPGHEIGSEVHPKHDQFFRIEGGTGSVEIDGSSSEISAGDAIIVPAGARHNVKNTGSQRLQLYTIYAPPEHRDGVVHTTKADAEGDSEHFDGKTTD
jgi:mannose-6-phosphate isomerase-like protein (cupin superfamily)